MCSSGVTKTKFYVYGEIFWAKKLPFSKHPQQPSGHQWKFFQGFSLSSGREVKVAFTSVQSEILKENIFLDKCKNSTFTEVVEDVFDWCPQSYFLGEFWKTEPEIVF